MNQGIGGEIFRLENLGSVPVTDPDIITVAYGTNDWAATSYKRITNKVPRYFERLRDLYSSARIIYISPIWRGDTNKETLSGDFDAHCDRVSDMAKAAGAYVIDGRKLIPHDSGVFADVVLHPNDLGFTRYADALVKEIRKLGILD